jgi:hypothetical protein
MALVSVATSCSKYYDVAKLDAGGGRSITVFAERYYEDDQAVYYRVEVDGRVTIPDSYASGIDPQALTKAHLKLVSNNSHSIVGVVDEQLPQKIWLLHNFATGETWPRCQSDTFEKCEQRGQALLAELQKDHHDVIFVL